MNENRRALILAGGWPGHRPIEQAEVIRNILLKHDFTCRISQSLDILENVSEYQDCDLIVSGWSQGRISGKAMNNVSECIANGMGLAITHAGLEVEVDDFDKRWHFITGGSWMGHPGDDKMSYEVNFCNESSSIVEGLDDFRITSEQFYLHVDPTVEVLAMCKFPNFHDYYYINKVIDMPVSWTKLWGNGRVFYSSLGHLPEEYSRYPTMKKLLERGMLWAAKKKGI